MIIMARIQYDKVLGKIVGKTQATTLSAHWSSFYNDQKMVCNIFLLFRNIHFKPVTRF